MTHEQLAVRLRTFRPLTRCSRCLALTFEWLVSAGSLVEAFRPASRGYHNLYRNSDSEFCAYEPAYRSARRIPGAVARHLMLSNCCVPQSHMASFRSSPPRQPCGGDLSDAVCLRSDHPGCDWRGHCWTATGIVGLFRFLCRHGAECV